MSLFYFYQMVNITEVIMSSKEIVNTLGKEVDDGVLKKVLISSLVILLSILLHDGDHIRQALNWGYSIPFSLLVLNLTVYIFPAVSIFLIKLRRMSSTLVTAIGGVFTTVGFLTIHLRGAASGLWGVWNYSYFALIRGVTWNGVFYQGVDWISWVFLFEVPLLCLPASFLAFREYLKLRKEKNA